MKLIRLLTAAALLSLVRAAPRLRAQSAPPTGPSSVPFWTGMADAAAFERAMDARLAHAAQLLDLLAAVKGGRTVANTLRPFDDVQLELDAVGSQAGLIQSVHPDETFRQAAERIYQKVGTVTTQLSLNRGAYEAMNRLDVSGADAETKYYVQRTLRDFRLAGVDKDEAARKRIQTLRDELTQISQAFDRNIREDLRTVTARSEADLEGLPRDFITRHKPDASGNSTLTIDYTYMWSLVIAKDLFSQFDRANLLAPGVARKYRDTILAPGGSKPAAALVQDFLGRPFAFPAWEAWLNRDEP